MSSALAAALRAFDRSRAVLETELLRHPDFVAWRRLELSPPSDAPTPGRSGIEAADEERRSLRAKLEMLPVFRAWQSILASRELIDGGPALPVPNQPTRPPDSGALAMAPSPSLPGTQPPRFTPPPGAPQALTAIRGVHPALAAQLQTLGIVRYEQIATWRAEDVRQVSAALGIGRAISRGNWIEQAALLAMRPQTAPEPGLSSRQPAPSHPTVRIRPAVDRSVILAAILTAAEAAVVGAHQAAHGRSSAPVGPGPAPATPFSPPASERAAPPPDGAAGPHARIRIDAPPRPQRRPVPRPVGARVAPPDPATAHEQAGWRETAVPDDDLCSIAGIDSGVASQLRGAGFVAFRQIATWQSADVTEVAARLGCTRRRISREGWIEQAALLAIGRPTMFSDRRARREFVALVPAPPQAPVLASPRAPVEDRRLHRVAADRAPALATPGPDGSARPTAAAPIAASVRGLAERSGAIPLNSGRSLVHRLDHDALPHDPRGDARADEATVSFAVADPAQPARMETAPEPVPTEVGRPVSPGRTTATATAAATAKDSWSTPATQEEAVVEIIRRDTSPDDYRPAASTRTAGAGNANASSPAPQPIWVKDKDAAAAGVMRRFMKALRRGPR